MHDYFPKYCKSFGLPVPTAEYQFAPTRKWRCDFYFEHNGIRLAVEIEGGAFTQGRHTRGKGFVADMEKYNALTECGIQLLRYTPDQLQKQSTYNQIKNVLKC